MWYRIIENNSILICWCTKCTNYSVLQNVRICSTFVRLILFEPKEHFKLVMFLGIRTSADDPPATPLDRGASGEEGPTQDPSPAGKGGKGAKPAGAGKKGGKGQGWCRLNLWAWTWVGSSQSQVTGKQTGRIKKPNSARTRFSKIRTWFSNVRTRFSNVHTWLSNVCTFHEMYDASCALNMSYKTLNVHVCTVYVHGHIIQKQT